MQLTGTRMGDESGTPTRLDTGTDQLLCSLEDGVATITLNRPERRNALSDQLTPALRQTLLTVEADPAVRCVVITGAGRAFCAGGDVSGMGGNAGGGSRPPAQTSLQDAVRRLKHGQETLTLRLFDLAKPTIAALPGPAAGAGLSIALACDLRIAAVSAFLVTAFANIGLSGDYGGSWLLTQLVGVARAKELYYTSRRVAADEALTLGIVNEVVPDGELMARTRELAQTIAAGPPIALSYMKQNLNRAVSADLRTCLAEEAERMVRCTRTDDHREAVRAFLEKRRPTFKGQ
jgi:2-(1,2-epoxy-1,2-dihydrophenyl)acetyl-CoA isomerase